MQIDLRSSSCAYLILFFYQFSTVDWIADSTRERARAARAHLRKTQGVSSNSHLANGSTSVFGPDMAWGKPRYGPGDKPPRWWPMSKHWGRNAWWFWRFLCRATGAVTDSGVVVLVGLLIGVNMAVISIATEWASDIKQGYCSAGWWLNQKFCCGGMTDSGPGGGAAIPAAIVAQLADAATSSNSSSTLLSSTSPISLGLAANNSSAAKIDVGPVVAAAARIGSRAVPLFINALSDLYARAGEAGQGGTSNLADTCEDWIPWSRWTIPSWFMFILWAVVLSSLCAHLVRTFAPYAAGSGISEIKCILAGFIINGFLGAWTFALKSMTLVCGRNDRRDIGVALIMTPLTATCHCIGSQCWKRRASSSYCLLHW